VNDAYAAGLFDGEGSVILNAGLYDALSLACTMHLTHEPTLRALAARYGGSVNSVKHLQPREAHWLPSWGWRVSGAEAEAFLRAVQPHLRIKGEQAALALEFRTTKVDLRSLTPLARAVEVERRRAFKLAMQVLNRSRFLTRSRDRLSPRLSA
jgi:hypothetical protein